jgi:hypothetical protein
MLAPNHFLMTLIRYFELWDVTAQMEAEGGCAVNVPQDPLEKSQMTLTRIMHVHASLLYNVCNVWKSNRQVL